jgi:hypothetical protein
MRANLADESVLELAAYPTLATSKEHEMPRIVRRFGCALFVCALAIARASAVHAEEPAKQDAAPPAAVEAGASAAPAFDPATADATALAEHYFDEAQRFDAFLTYEVTRGPARAVFTVARRWKAGLAELMFDVREPAEFDRWAALVRQTRGGSDDLFFYVDRTGSTFDRRIRRIPSAQLERHAFFDMLAIGDYRPTSRGELSYTAGPDELQGEVPCRVVIGTTPAPYLGFDRLELVFAKASGLLLEERYFRGSREIRRLTSKPEDFREVDGRRLPFRRTARSWPDTGPTEIVLVAALETPDLPDNLFSAMNLTRQHFPKF